MVGLPEWLIGGVGTGLLQTAFSDLGDLGTEGREYARELAETQMEQAQFQPYTVTSATGGTFTAGPDGQYTLGLSGPEAGMQQALFGQAGQFLGQPTSGADQLQQAGLSSLGAGQNLMGQPVFGMDPTRAASMQAAGLGQQFMGASAAQPADINLLRGQFAGQVPELITQRPAEGISSLGQQAISAATQGLGLGEVGVLGGPVTDVTGTYSDIQLPDVRRSAGQLAERGLGLGMAGLETTAPEDVEALRAQYGGLAGQAAADLLQPTADREAEVFERIRATQRPEEERRQLELEQRLAAQGRLGVRTAQYGGTPEQLALAKAQEEAQDKASLAAIQQAQSERQQALGEAQTLGGMFSGQAGLSSQLQSQEQQRAAQLSQLGLSAEQMQAQLESEGFGQEMQLAGAGLQAQQAQSALESQSQQRATQLAQLGLSAEQIQSQLQSEGLGRAATAAGQTAQLAQLAGGLQAQQAGLGMDYASLGAGLAGQAQGLSAAQQAQALQAMQGGQGLLAGAQGLQAGQQQLGLGALAGSYIPQQQLLAALSPGQTAAAQQQQAQLYGTGLFGEATASGLDILLASQLGRANLAGGLGSGLVGGLLDNILDIGKAMPTGAKMQQTRPMQMQAQPMQQAQPMVVESSSQVPTASGIRRLQPMKSN